MDTKLPEIRNEVVRYGKEATSDVCLVVFS